MTARVELLDCAIEAMTRVASRSVQIGAGRHFNKSVSDKVLKFSQDFCWIASGADRTTGIATTIRRTAIHASFGEVSYDIASRSNVRSSKSPCSSSSPNSSSQTNESRGVQLKGLSGASLERVDALIELLDGPRSQRCVRERYFQEQQRSLGVGVAGVQVSRGRAVQRRYCSACG